MFAEDIEKNMNRAQVHYSNALSDVGHRDPSFIHFCLGMFQWNRRKNHTLARHHLTEACVSQLFTLILTGIEL